MTTTTEQRLFVSEIFGPTLQGEGSVAGLRTMFLRLGGCDGADGKRNWCTWCDSMFAVDPVNKAEWRRMTTWEIISELREKAGRCRNVSITGGNPGLYDLTDLIIALHEEGWKVNVETQATIFRSWMADVEYLTMSPKPPSAGAITLDIFIDFLDALAEAINELDCPPELCLKVVVGGDLDMGYAQRCLNRMTVIPDHVSWSAYLSLLTLPDDTRDSLLDRYAEVAEHLAAQDNEITRTLSDFHLLPQLHVVMWGHGRGV